MLFWFFLTCTESRLLQSKRSKLCAGFGQVALLQLTIPENRRLWHPGLALVVSERRRDPVFGVPKTLLWMGVPSPEERFPGPPFEKKRAAPKLGRLWSLPQFRAIHSKTRLNCLRLAKMPFSLRTARPA